MKTLLVFIIVFLGTALQAQKMYKHKLENCSPQFQLEDKSITLEYTKGDSLLIMDIMDGAEKKHIQRLKGILALQIILDSAGNSCLVSYDHRFNMLRKPFDIVENVNALEAWEGTGNNTYRSIFMKIYFEKKQIRMQRLGYNRNTGWTILLMKTFMKEEELEDVKSSTKNKKDNE